MLLGVGNMSWQHFSNVSCIESLHSKCGSELTFEKCCQEAATCPGNISPKSVCYCLYYQNFLKSQL